MDRQQLAHILRAACRVTGDPDVLVLGSQSILGTYDEDDLPAAATASMEADIAFLDDDDRAKADKVDAEIGELSSFHQSQGIYAEGVHIDVAILPLGWRDRIHGWPLSASSPARAWFLEAHDLAVAKLVAGRPKDLEFVFALLEHGLIDRELLLGRLSEMPVAASPIAVDRALRHLS